MLKINSLRKINFIGSIIAIVLSTFSLGAYSIYDIFQHSKKESHAFEERYIQSQKNILSTYVNQTIEHIVYHQAHAEEWLKKDIKERVYAGYEIALSIYNRYHKTKTIEEIREAVKAADSYQGIAENKMDEMKEAVRDSFNDLCTGCQYCDDCPVEIPIPKYMEAYNFKKLYNNEDKQLLDRLKWHWDIPSDWAARCTECGQCEDVCTQHLPIIERLKEIAAMKTES